jgi:predicted dienelactone hydrolase
MVFLGGVAGAPRLAAARNVGFQEVRVANGADKPLVVGIWYPTDAPATPGALGAFTQTVARDAVPAGKGLALIVMSHGTGGWYGEHYDTALELARAGFVVAAVSHTGDTYDDQSRGVLVTERPLHIRRLIDYMLSEWPSHETMDGARIGVFGFSAGGFTALVAAGGVPDFGRLPAHWRAHPDYFDSQLAKRAGLPMDTAINVPAAAWAHDPRIKAAVVAAPALGFTFGAGGLKTVTLPMQLWRADEDHILPNPDYAEAVRVALPSPPEYHVVKEADHFDFLAPCDDQLRQFAPQICVSRPGFDRAAFHDVFNHEVVRFFTATLKYTPAA